MEWQSEAFQRDIDSIREYLRRTDNKSGVYDFS